eukprot:TRINITY_DN2485_c0_g1_i9.p1 TRINITY_DN2485_c0_g1~~TRINITY_DN2485_c0_g1_i9.p1  ORF type:complete len:313 (-),score=56.24 TRINITY_DN2485_c0_g1_i9:125-1063(-)
MSVIISTPEQIFRSPHNTSSAKPLYTFPHASRFSLFNRRSPCDRYYELPSARTKRTTTFGYGDRLSFKGYGRNNSPPPGSYNTTSIFGTQQKGQVYSFGASRDAYAKVYIKKHPWRDPSLPGPGAYDLKAFPGGSTKQYSMRPKTLTAGNWGETVGGLLKGTPGPGTYAVNSLINKDGRQVLSSMESSKASNFNPPSSDRFKYLFSGKRNMPGPGEYEPIPGVSPNGKQYYANFASSRCRTFGNEARSFPKLKQSEILNPGPGAYTLPSDFGIYQAHQKFVEETEKLERKRMTFTGSQSKLQSQGSARSYRK